MTVEKLRSAMSRLSFRTHGNMEHCGAVELFDLLQLLGTRGIIVL